MRGAKPSETKESVLKESVSAACTGTPVRRNEPCVPEVSLLLDGIVFCLQTYGGISVYFRELLSRLERDSIKTLLTFDGPPLQSPVKISSGIGIVNRTPRVLERYRGCRLPAGFGPTVFHSSYYRRPTDRSVPSVVTVYDFVYEKHVTGLKRSVHSTQKAAAIRSAQAVICISQATLDDLEEIVGLRPSQSAIVIPLAAGAAFRPLLLPEASRPYVLFVGQRAGYKNFRTVLAALDLSPEIELRCVGGGDLADDLQHVPESVRSRVKHLGFVNDQELNVLYNQALCLAYPSRYEGFGIPVVEAMRAGCPVVSIACRAVMEVGGDALVVSDDDGEALAKAFSKLRDARFRADVISRGIAVGERYEWERCYDMTMDVYRQLSS